MKLHLSLKTKVCIWILGGLLAPSLAFAQGGDLVEVEINQDYLAPYKDRRDTHGTYFGVQYEQVVFPNYVSTTQPGIKFKGLFGDKPVELIRLNFDYKYNFALGSLAIGADLGFGAVQGSASGSSTTLDVTKYGINLQYAMDMIWPEPYGVPYFGLSVWQMELAEKGPTDSFSATTSIGYNYMVGVLVSLNWIDPDVAKDATFNFGLENTYLDLYMTQYAKTENAKDPNTESDLGWGAGLRLEF